MAVGTERTRGRRRLDIDWRRLHHASWSLVGVGVLVVAAVWLAGRLWTVLLALGIALLCVFFLRPIVEWLSARRVPRVLSVVIAYLLSLCVLILVAALLVPPIAAQLALFGDQLPTSLSRLGDLVGRLREGYAGLAIPDWLADYIDDALAGLGTQVSDSLSVTAAWLFSLGARTLGLLTAFVTGLAVGFYMLASLPAVGPAILRAMPPGWRRDLREAGQRVEDVVGGFVRGQLLIAVSVGVLTWLGMVLVGMPYPVLIGVVAGLADIVPYLGPIVAALVAALIGLLADPALALWAVLIVFAVQQIEGAVLQPKIFGGQVGLHPAVVILAVVTATTLFGFAGLLVAVPLVGTSKALYGYFAEKHGWQPWSAAFAQGEETSTSGADE